MLHAEAFSRTQGLHHTSHASHDKMKTGERERRTREVWRK